MSVIVPITKMDAAKQVVMGAVYIPYHLDSQNEFMSPEEIEKAAYSFMRKSVMSSVDKNHNVGPDGAPASTTGSDVVESFIARKGDPDFVEGSWVVAVKVSASLWEDVLKGEINGFSMEGRAGKVERLIEIEIPDDGIVKGDTMPNEDHSHVYSIKISDKGEFLGGQTDEVAGHSHKILKGTATEKSAGHSHRFSFLEALNESHA